MKVYQTQDIRNIALIGGNRTGKTTLAETMAFHGGVISRRGTVEDKNTLSDYREVELERQQSIQSSVLYSEFENTKFNMIDCPGFDDFVGEVIGALRVADTAVMVINAQNGVDVGAESQWRWTKKMHKPVVFVVNQLDHEKANFDETLRELKHNFGGSVLPLQYPVNAGIGFDSVIDLLSKKLLKFPAGGGKMIVEEIPASEADKAEEMHAALIEAAAENDEKLMDKFFEEGTPQRRGDDARPQAGCHQPRHLPGALHLRQGRPGRGPHDADHQGQLPHPRRSTSHQEHQRRRRGLRLHRQHRRLRLEDCR